MVDLLNILGLTPESMQNQIMMQQVAQRQQQPAPVNLTQAGSDNTDWLSQLQAARSQKPSQAMPMASYQPTSGSEMEADAHSSIDDLMSQLAAQRTQYRAQDQAQQWMSFFSKLASSKSNTLLGGLGEGADALTTTAAKQNANNQLLDQAALQDQVKYREWQQDQKRQQQVADQTGKYQEGELGLKRQELELGKYLPVKDAFGNVSAILDARTGKIISTNPSQNTIGGMSSGIVNQEPSSDPQEAAQQILDEQGTPFTPVQTRQDITGRNQQAKAYRDAANAAKATQQQLDMLNAQTGKYIPGKMANMGYGLESATDTGGDGASARTEADKASKALANSFMAANTGAKGAGIRMVEFDAGAVPNADMTDEARTQLIQKNKAIADSQIQRAAISDMYPRMHMSNVNSIMDNYETKNPPILPTGTANPNWMSYKDWLKAGRPNTAMTLPMGDASKSVNKSASKTIHFNDLPE